MPPLLTSQGHPTPTLFALAAMVAALALLHLARRSFLLAALVSLPGTFAHELCHWIIGRLLNGQPRSFTVLPRRQGRGIVLGSVGFAHLRWYNAPFIGLAPLLLLPGAYGLFRWQLQGAPDLRIAAGSPLGWLLVVAALAWGWMRLHGQTSSAPQSWKLTRSAISRPAPGRGGLPPEPGTP